MALTRFNYQPGQYETCTDETLTPASPVLNTWYNFEIGDWKHAISDVVLKQGGLAIPTSAYELAIDTKYTTWEVGESDKTIYAKWRIVNATYDEIATTVSGNNFGTYIDNAKLDSRLDALEAFDAALDAGEVPYDNSSSGLAADDVQEAVDEVLGMIPAVHDVAIGVLTSDASITDEATLQMSGTGFNSGVYTVPTTGKYLITVSVVIKGGASGVLAYLSLKKGSTILGQAWHTTTSNYNATIPIPYAGDFAASDTILVTARRDGGSTLKVEGQSSPPLTYINITKLT